MCTKEDIFNHIISDTTVEIADVNDLISYNLIEYKTVNITEIQSINYDINYTIAMAAFLIFDKIIVTSSPGYWLPKGACVVNLLSLNTESQEKLFNNIDLSKQLHINLNMLFGPYTTEARNREFSLLREEIMKIERFSKKISKWQNNAS